MIKEREEFYISLIKSSSSLIEVCRKANIVPTTGNYDTLKKIIKNNQIDISHFKRLGNNNALKNKKETSEYLMRGIKVSSYKLKNRLLKEGYKEYKCEKCGRTEWEGEPIPLELHHINGDNTDNRLENLEILCPNCHSFTDTYGGKNQKINIKKEGKILTNDIKDEITSASLKYDSIKNIAKTTKHSERTIKKILEKRNIIINKNAQIKENNDKKIPLIIESLRKTKSFTGTAREFGVSDNAIKKLLVSRGYPKHIKDVLKIIE